VVRDPGLGAMGGGGDSRTSDLAAGGGGSVIQTPGSGEPFFFQLKKSFCRCDDKKYDN